MLKLDQEIKQLFPMFLSKEVDDTVEIFQNCKLLDEVRNKKFEKFWQTIFVAIFWEMKHFFLSVQCR